MTKLTAKLAFGAAMLFTASVSQAAVTIDYSWENGGTILGSFGNLADPQNVSVGSDPGAGSTINYDPALTVTPRTGSGMLQVTESPNGGTPQAYVAYIEGLAEGDEVTASFYAWDSTPDENPSVRIWGHYALNGDVDSYDGSASGNSTYTVGVLDGGWEQVTYTWTIPADKQALVVEYRLYSPTTTDAISYWADDLSVTAPDGATINVPSAVPEPSTYAAMAGLLCLGVVALRRRKMRA